MYTKAVSYQQSGCLGVVHISTATHDTLQYISSSRAIKEQAIRIEEVSEGGSVNHLVVMNQSDEHVFLMDGDVLQGAKQTRVLNTSVFLAPRSKTIIPVSCVEQGRWRFTSRTMSGSEYIAPSTLRARKAKSTSEGLLRSARHAADQGEVWRNVAEYHSSLSVSSATGSLHDAFVQRQKDFEEFVRGINPHPEANGLAVFVGKNLLCLDLFNRRDIYQEYLPKIMRGVAAEAIHLKGQAEELPEAEAVYRAVDFLDRFEEREFSEHPGVALGMEKRFSNDDLAGFTLSYDDLPVHTTALNLQPWKETS